jgi:hypothetical protein
VLYSTLLEALLRWDHFPQTNAFLFRRDWLAKVAWNDTDVYRAGCRTQKLCLDLLRQGAKSAHVAITGFTYRNGWSYNQLTAQNPKNRMATRGQFQGEIFAYAQQQCPGQYDAAIALTTKRYNHENSLLQ